MSQWTVTRRYALTRESCRESPNGADEPFAEPSLSRRSSRARMRSEMFLKSGASATAWFVVVRARRVRHRLSIIGRGNSGQLQSFWSFAISAPRAAYLGGLVYVVFVLLQRVPTCDAYKCDYDYVQTTSMNVSQGGRATAHEDQVDSANHRFIKQGIFFVHFFTWREKRQRQTVLCMRRATMRCHRLTPLLQFGCFGFIWSRISEEIKYVEKAEYLFTFMKP